MKDTKPHDVVPSRYVQRAGDHTASVAHPKNARTESAELRQRASEVRPKHIAPRFGFPPIGELDKTLRPAGPITR